MTAAQLRTSTGKRTSSLSWLMAAVTRIGPGSFARPNVIDGDEHQELEQVHPSVAVLIRALSTEQDSVSRSAPAHMTLHAQGKRPGSPQTDAHACLDHVHQPRTHRQRRCASSRARLGRVHRPQHQLGAASFHAAPQAHCILRLTMRIAGPSASSTSPVRATPRASAKRRVWRAGIGSARFDLHEHALAQGRPRGERSSVFRWSGGPRRCVRLRGSPAADQPQRLPATALVATRRSGRSLVYCSGRSSVVVRCADEDAWFSAGSLPDHSHAAGRIRDEHRAMTTGSGAVSAVVSEYFCGGGCIHPSPRKPVLERTSTPVVLGAGVTALSDHAVSGASIAVAPLSYRQRLPVLAILRHREEFLPDRYQGEVQFGTGSVEPVFVDGDDG